MKRKQLRLGKGFRIALTNKRAQIAEMVLPPGDTEGDADNRHRGSDQWLYVVAGRGSATVGKRNYPLRAGTVLLIEQGDRHQITNTGRSPLQTLNFYIPPAYDKRGEPLPRGKK